VYNIISPCIYNVYWGRMEDHVTESSGLMISNVISMKLRFVLLLNTFNSNVFGVNEYFERKLKKKIHLIRLSFYKINFFNGTIFVSRRSNISLLNIKLF